MPSQRLPQIDILRGIAVILVLFRHHWVGIDALQHVGWVGVDLFFVLSGFLVSGLLFAEHKKTHKVRRLRFLVRRGFKIYPMFYLSLGVTIAIILYISPNPWSSLTPHQQFAGSVYEALFLQNYKGSFWGHHWSLAVEEHFYLGLALLFPLILRYAKTIIPLAFIACLAMRLYYVAILEAPAAAVFEYTHLRIDSLFAGVAIAYIYHFGDLQEIWHRYKWLLRVLAYIPILFIFYDPTTSSFTLTLGISWLYVAFGSWLILALYSTWRFPLLEKVGKYSYGIYLFHLWIIQFVVGDTYLYDQPHEFTVQTLQSFVIFFSLSIAVGMGVSMLVEKPFLSLRDWMIPRTAA